MSKFTRDVVVPVVIFSVAIVASVGVALLAKEAGKAFAREEEKHKLQIEKTQLEIAALRAKKGETK
jgi:hypothetical protein